MLGRVAEFQSFNFHSAGALQIISAALLAWATVKPQFTWLFTGFILLYALRSRWYPYLFAFFASLLALFAVSFAFVPTWIGAWLERVQQSLDGLRDRMAQMRSQVRRL